MTEDNWKFRAYVAEQQAKWWKAALLDVLDPDTGNLEEARALCRDALSRFSTERVASDLEAA